MKKVIVIDNYDSFTYILKQYLGELGGNPEVFFNNQISIAQLKRLKPTHIVLSPGPGTVYHKRDVGIMEDVIKAFYRTTPILGVCLGHQILGKFFGARIVPAPRVMHGKRSPIWHMGEGIFKGLPNPLEAMRYHSLVIETPFYLTNSNVDVAAHTSEWEIMGIVHRHYPLFGVQFHPESLGTPDGMKIIRNFLKY
ncbi:MAG: aminodeoxychorismate/anthranilate synthase component II [Candidatus Peregrinibacteria bacterium]